MRNFVLAIFTVAFLAWAVAAQNTQYPTCGVTANCGPSSASVCVNNKYCCPPTAPCGFDTPGAAAPFGCCTKGVNCPTDKPVTCFGDTKGDPLMRSFQGCQWYLNGKADTVMNLISETSHVVNTQLVDANLIDEHHGVPGTFHGAISVRYLDAVAIARVDAEGNLTASLDGTSIPFEAVRHHSGMTVKISEHYPYYGQVVEFVTPAFRFFVHAVQPYNTSAGWNRGHLDFSATVTADVDMHGLLGQSSVNPGSLCNDDFSFHGMGVEEDYIMQDLDSIEFMYNQFNHQKATRRLASTGPAYSAATTVRVAASEGLL